MLTQKVVHEIFLATGGSLRVLSLSQSSITELPDSIGYLQHLRYLDLYETKVREIPSSVCTLYNLQTLLLSGCKELKQLPTNISKLINLRHLMIRDTSLREMPPQLCNMTNLQTLSDFVLSEHGGSRIKELGELQLLHGSLCISGLENVKDVGDVLEGNLKNKKYLSELILRWDGETSDSTKEREVLNALQPHVNLKKLKIIGYRGTSLPNWVAHRSYCNLVKISLARFPNCCLLPPFGQLGLLKELQIDRMDGFLGIYDEFCSTSYTNPFQFLVILELSRMNMWEWSFINGGDQEGNIFPCLKKVRLNSCQNLNVGLPIGHLPSLEHISIQKCDQMVAVLPTSPHIDTAYPSVKTLEIFSCSRLESFSGTGLPSSLKKLEIYDCNMLLANRMNWNLQRISSLVDLVVYGSRFDGYDEAMDSFPEEGLLPPTLRNLSISCFTKLKALNIKGFQHLISFQQLHLLHCYLLQCLPEEGLPRTLTSLDIYKCPLLSPRCQRETGEDWPKIQHIPRIYIDRNEI